MNLTNSEIESLCAINEETYVPIIIIDPSDWYESKKILMSSGSSIPGYVEYKNTPYWKEPVNCISQYHPARDITIVGPAQDGKTFMVLEPMIGYTIECNPGNILHLTGNSELSPDAGLRIDTMIDNCKIRYLIRPSIQKTVKNRTGDTAIRKEFPDGIYRVNSITKKNALRQNDIAVMIVDDTDAAKRTDAKVGNLRDTAKGRTKAFSWRCKRVWTSSPEILETSFIWESWELSDKRMYFIPCPCEGCGEMITLESSFVKDTGENVGLYWELDEHGRVEPKSVCYICQVCGGRFDERDKLKWMNKGEWRSTCTPKELYHYGFKKNGLLASPGMTSWYDIAVNHEACNLPGQPRIESKWQTFLNIMMGEPYSPPSEAPKANDLIKNARDYPIGIIPESVSEGDGNGDILLLVATFDCNGSQNDARIDAQLKAISRAGATYSVIAKSFGTFIPNQSAEQKAKDSRQKWTYEMNRENSVWKLVDEFLDTPWNTDTGRIMKIGISGLDTGNDYKDTVYNYLDKTRYSIYGLMGDKEYDLVRHQLNMPIFKQASSRHNLYMINVNAVKDDVANRMKLPWDRKNEKNQPHLFMNFPNYTSAKFFSHYESESRRENEKGYFGWQKKSPTAQNHFWDTEIYYVATLDIYLWQLMKKFGKNEVFTWVHYASLCAPRKK